MIAVVGETASGKSSLALEIAKRYDGEIICADSRTIYKGMDVGTAKPRPEEQAQVAHHLLDVAEPGVQFTAADFKRLAEEAIKDITARGKLPILVGGTGLYVDSIIFDYQFARVANSTERTRLDALDIAQLSALIKERGLSVPENEKNKRYLIRTLERGAGTANDREVLRPRTLVIGLKPSRLQLRQRIESRVEQMFRRGLRREVEELQQKYGWDSEALTGIGYREFRSLYEGHEVSMSAIKRQIVQDTLALAKRQRTWFKRNPHIVWLEEAQQAYPLIDAFLGR